MGKILSVLILISGMYLKGQEVQKFDVNDPRNPDCPCHKYQKLAEEEYKKILASAEKKRPEKKKEIKLNENGRSSARQKTSESGISLSEKEISKNERNNSGKTGNNSSGSTNAGGNINHGNFSGGAPQKKSISQNHIRRQKKKHIKKHPLWNQVKEWHGWNACKESRVVSACFHWK